MTDDGLPFATTAGDRPPHAGADRFMVALAIVVLLGAALIIVGKVLPKSEGTAAATPTPAATARASATPKGSPTPRPTPSPRPLGVVALLEGQPPAATPQPSQPFSGWIRARQDLVLHGEASADSPNLGTLSRGSIANVYEDWNLGPSPEGWLYVQDPQPGGWIATMDNGVSLVDRITSPTVRQSGYIAGLVGGASNYLAFGTPPYLSDINVDARLLISSTGTSWRWADAPTGAAFAVYGPAGYLTYTVATSDADRYGNQVQQPWMWASATGASWQPLGAWIRPDSPDGNFNIGSLIGSSRGYMVISWNDRGGQSTWFSPDAVTWFEMADPGFDRSAWLNLAATPLGFYAWDAQPPGQRSSPSSAVAAFSPDGAAWRRVDVAPPGQGLQLGAVDGRLIGISPDPVAGSPQVWTGTPSRGSLIWRRDTSQEPVFAGTVVTSIASDGTHLAAFGWRREGERPIAWIRQGSVWRQIAMPASFGGFPNLSAAGPNGFAVVGYRPNLRGGNPVIWHLSPDGRWTSEANPVIQAVPDPTSAECPAPPGDALSFMIVDRATAPACLGGMTLTFRVWSASCDGCYGDQSGRRQPAWLAEPTDNQLFLSPIETYGGNWSNAVLSPALDLDPRWTNHWLEITGHFDDPAALSCVWDPSPEESTWYSGHDEVVNGCRQQFVVTAVRLVDGP